MAELALAHDGRLGHRDVGTGGLRRRRVRRRPDITSWVEAHFTAETVGGVTVYDLAG